MKKHRPFCPEEIIFSCTTACNLHCQHCFVNREPKRISIDAAKKFLLSCKGTSIEKIGFSGGEPFLYLEFLCEITRAGLENDFMFDQIMTNGDWWKGEADLRLTLQKVYDSGYDGKIGLSWDSYHGQSTERMQTFIRTVQEIFGEDSINIQTVDLQGENSSMEEDSLKSADADFLTAFDLSRSSTAASLIYHLTRSFPSEDSRAWQNKKWFKEDYCEGPGHIFYVHADGNIAPCCGFANENPALFIGTIDDSFEKLMQNASQNRMIEICYEEGLFHFRRHGLKKLLKEQEKKLPKGKCGEICSFCDFVCKNI